MEHGGAVYIAASEGRSQAAVLCFGERVSEWVGGVRADPAFPAPCWILVAVLCRHPPLIAVPASVC
jgi:hypothetical protein